MSDKSKKPKGNRTRKARWRRAVWGVVYMFEYQPIFGTITIRKRFSRQEPRTITMDELIHVVGGQRLLPL